MERECKNLEFRVYLNKALIYYVDFNFFKIPLSDKLPIIGRWHLEAGSS
jgi:hypothetical protein